MAKKRFRFKSSDNTNLVARIGHYDRATKSIITSGNDDIYSIDPATQDLNSVIPLYAVKEDHCHANQEHFVGFGVWEEPEKKS